MNLVLGVAPRELADTYDNAPGDGKSAGMRLMADGHIIPHVDKVRDHCFVIRIPTQLLNGICVDIIL